MSQLYFARDIVETIDGLIDDVEHAADKHAILAQAQKILGILKEQKIVRSRKLTASDILPHPKNRAGAMLNPYNVHKNGVDIYTIGANIAELHGSVAFELSPQLQTKQDQLSKNQGLVTRSKGLLAPLNGGEGFLSVGSGHCAAFCRAALAGCRTPFQKIATGGGRFPSRSFARTRTSPS